MTTQSHLTALYININSSNVFATIVSSIVALDFGTITLINSLGWSSLGREDGPPVSTATRDPSPPACFPYVKTKKQKSVLTIPKHRNM
jgi:hypothetical protein